MKEGLLAAPGRSLDVLLPLRFGNTSITVDDLSREVGLLKTPTVPEYRYTDWSSFVPPAEFYVSLVWLVLL